MKLNRESDHSDIAELQRRMESLMTEMDARADALAKARQIKEFIGDRKKAILGRCLVAIHDGNPELSGAAAEHRARASSGYKEQMAGLTREMYDAENEIVLNELLRTRLDVARSFLAMERTKLDRI